MLLAFFVAQKKKPEYLLGVEPDDDTRDNVIYYDEEGAGEGGPMEAPMTMSSAPPPMHEPRREWDEMPRMGEFL